MNWDILKLALNELRQHAFRSLLTCLGIVFGVAGVIAMQAIGKGGRAEVMRQLEGLGLNNIILSSIKPTVSQQGGKKRSAVFSYGLTEDDAQRFTESFPGVSLMTGLRDSRFLIYINGQATDFKTWSTNQLLIDSMNLQVKEGRFFSDIDMTFRNKVCVLGKHLAKNYYGLSAAIGQMFPVGGQGYTVIGVVEKNQAGLGDLDVNNAAFVPSTTHHSSHGATSVVRLGGSHENIRLDYDHILLTFEDNEHLYQAAKRLPLYIAKHHPKQDVQFQVPLHDLEQKLKVQKIFDLVLLAVTSISLLVGGIGIMNIMMATVSERISEIGIRQVLGATPMNIISQFLMEAVALSFIGGMIGIGFSLILTDTITHFSGIPTIHSGSMFVISLAIACLTGLIFGTWPAIKASKLDPVDALRT